MLRPPEKLDHLPEGVLVYETKIEGKPASQVVRVVCIQHLVDHKQMVYGNFLLIAL